MTQKRRSQEYHQHLKDVICQIGNEGVKAGKYKAVEREKKIWITDPKLGCSTPYKPEVHFTTKLTQKLVMFEVLDSQLRDRNLIIADIILSYLAPHAAKVIFIIPDKQREDEVYKLAHTIGAILEKKGVKTDERVKPLVYTISRDEAKSNGIVDILKGFSKDDRW